MTDLTLTDVQPDKEYTVTEKPKAKHKLPPWDAFGGNLDYASKIANFPDLYDKFQKMSKQTAWLWWELVKRRDRFTNISVYIPKDKTAENALTKAYRELNGLDLIKRVKPQHYIINPIALLPEFQKFPDVTAAWDSI